MGSTLVRPELTDHPVDVGHRSEAAILSQLVRQGYRVLLPFGVNQRYDMVLDNDGRLLKVQCKTGRLKEGAIRFSAQSVQSNMNGTRTRAYSGEVDLFAVYCPDNDRVYVIPANEVPATGMYLRVEMPRNSQRKRVRWAEDYVLPA
ncbi:MAG TPA: group I intron-associated PD-(D/E)XK endonuclease [Solirubrobacterales bacterium]|nr:group I intron-associated PD-(D/E)XK endonuclease [Solirubrobacterales bacterium]